MKDHEDNRETPQTDHFLACLPEGLPAEEKLDQLAAHARTLEKVWQHVTKDRLQLLGDTLGKDAEVAALRDLCGHAAAVLQSKVAEVAALRDLCGIAGAEIASGGDLQDLAQVLQDAAGEGVAGLEQSEEELLHEAAEIVRAWRVLKQYGTGDEEALRQRRQDFDADCEASGFSSLEMLERGEKKLDQDNADRILGQQH